MLDKENIFWLKKVLINFLNFQQSHKHMFIFN